jgi:S1-C subfamily serine protease
MERIPVQTLARRAAGMEISDDHVIENSTKITATVTTTGKTYPAALIGYDKTADVALIRLQGATGLHTIPIGNSAAAKTGEQVVALGNAEGTGAIIRTPALNHQGRATPGSPSRA